MSELYGALKASLAGPIFYDVAWIQNTVRDWEMMTWPPTQGIRRVQSDHKPISFKEGDTKPRPYFFHITNAINMLKYYGVKGMGKLLPCVFMEK